MMTETRNILDYEFEPQPHKWAAYFWLPLAILLTLSVIGAPVGILIFVIIWSRCAEHGEWRKTRKG